METMFIGIAGGSGSGKTTLTRRLKERYPRQIAVVNLDNYYKRHDELPFEERCKLNYDHPDAFDNDLLLAHLKQLRAGHSIQCPVYDYRVHNRSDRTIRIDPAPVVIVEAFCCSPYRSCATSWTSRCLWTRTPTCEFFGAFFGT